MLLSIIQVTTAYAEGNCFIAMEKDKVLKQEGDCKSRHAPNSTFKIAISLMGYDGGILTDETRPEWLFKEGYSDFLAVWKEPQNPTTWMKNSCVWYSQVLTQQLGMDKFKSYLKKLDYGNQDASGGITESWLSNSIQISPIEQVALLQKLVDNKLPVSLKAQQMTKAIISHGDLVGWNLYGKTGSGYLLNADGSLNRERKNGWFVGWLNKGERNVFFAQYIEDKEKNEAHAGPRAKEIAKGKMVELLN